MKTAIVVIRKLFDNEKVISRVVAVPATYDWSDTAAINSFGQRMTDDEKKRMSDQFPEFASAEWSFISMELKSN